MKKTMLAGLLVLMIVGLSTSVFAGRSGYSNKWDGDHSRNWVLKYEDWDDGCVTLGNNPHTILNKHNRGNNPHKLLAHIMCSWDYDWWG